VLSAIVRTRRLTLLCDQTVHSLTDKNLVLVKSNAICDTYIREGGKLRLALPTNVRKTIEKEWSTHVDVFATAYNVIQDDLYEALYR
jgi:hypothetical protein